MEGVVLEQLGERHLEDLDDLTGMGNEGRQRVDDPDEGRDREARPDGRERVELGDDLDRGRREADLLLGLTQRRVLGGVDAGTEPATGEETSPWWVGIVSGRFVRMTCASSSASKSGTSTAAGRLSGISNGGGCGAGSAASARATGPGRAGAGRRGDGSRGRVHRPVRPGGGGCAAPRPGMLTCGQRTLRRGNAKEGP